MIYVIRMGIDDIVKIGFTSSKKTLAKRIKMLQTGSPFELRVESQFGGSRLKERYLHDQCKARHMHGEWFRLTKEEVKRLTIKYKDWSPKDNNVTKVSDIYHIMKISKINSGL